MLPFPDAYLHIYIWNSRDGSSVPIPQQRAVRYPLVAPHEGNRGQTWRIHDSFLPFPIRLPADWHQRSYRLHLRSDITGNRDDNRQLHWGSDESVGNTILRVHVRPPSGKNKGGHESFSQCVEYDSFFGEISQTIGAENAYVNRAFAYAIKNTSYNLWGPDNAHVSEYGAYLAVCVFFATLYDTSSSILESNDIIPDADAIVLQEIADKIVLEGYIPW